MLSPPLQLAPLVDCSSEPRSRQEFQPLSLVFVEIHMIKVSEDYWTYCSSSQHSLPGLWSPCRREAEY